MVAPLPIPLRKDHRQAILRLNQQLTNRQLAIILRDGAIDAEKLAKQISSLPSGIGGTTRAAQLRLAARGAREISSELWNQANTSIRHGIFKSVDLALNQAMDLDRLVGMPTSSILGYAEAMQVSAGTTAQALVNRRQFGYNLSERVYLNTRASIGRIHRTIESGLVRNLSARELAKEVKGLIDPSTPGGVSYAANRLARTEINNAYHWTAREHMASRPWINGVEWLLSGSHPEPDQCDTLADEGPYASNEVPDKPHPQCLCSIIPLLPSEDEFLDSLLGGDYDDYLQGLDLSPAGIYSSAKLPVSPELEKLVTSLRDQGVSWANIAKEAQSRGLIETANPNRMKRIYEGASVPKGPAIPTTGGLKLTETRTAARRAFDPNDPSTYKISAAEREARRKSLREMDPDFEGEAVPNDAGRFMAQQWSDDPEWYAEQGRFALARRYQEDLNYFISEGFDEDIYQALEEVIDYLKERYPTPASRVVWLKGGVGEKPDSIAWAYRGTDAIYINDKYAKQGLRWEVMNKASKASGFKASGGVRGTLFHEFGHQIHFTLPKQFEEELFEALKDHLKDFYDTGFILNKAGATLDDIAQFLDTTVSEGLSTYATTNKFEFIAEAFGEYHTSPNPRPIAKIVGQTIDKWVGGL